MTTPDQGTSTTARFRVTDTFQVSGRGTIVAGLLQTGELRKGMVLEEEQTGQPVQVVGVEIHTRPSKDGPTAAFVADPTSAPMLRPGMTLLARPE